jgi:folylpolyglutamate synthase/dihydropteroate synthase
MTYHNAIKYIKNAPNVTPKNSSAKQRIARLCKTLGDPQKRIKYVRLAGSNGKSVCAQMLTSILNEAKICNGSLTMPLHEDLRENVKVRIAAFDK